MVTLVKVVRGATVVTNISDGIGISDSSDRSDSSDSSPEALASFNKCPHDGFS